MKTGSINLSKIPKDKIWRTKKGDAMINVIIWENDKEDQYGNHGAFQVQLSKEDRDAGEKGPYIGNFKDWDRVAKDDEPEEADIILDNSDELPF